MKLYNLFESVILEEIEKAKRLLTEGVSTDSVNDAINGKYNVNILYRDYDDQPPSKRYIQVYNLSKTKGGNDAIRAYQIFGGSKGKNNKDLRDAPDGKGGVTRARRRAFYFKKNYTNSKVITELDI